MNEQPTGQSPPADKKRQHGERAEQESNGGNIDADASDERVRVVDRRWWARSEESERTETDRTNKPSYVAELEKQLTSKDELLRDYADRYRTAADEFDRTRDRLRREVAKDVEREKRRVLAAFLEVVDNLDRALEASLEASQDAPVENTAVLNLRQGVEMVRQQFLATLGSYGVTVIEASGKPFDPNLHDAISTVPVSDVDHEAIVIDVIKPGYQVNDEILRPASVTVGKLDPTPQ